MRPLRRCPALPSPAVQPGDHITLQPEGTSTFEVVDLDDTHATVTPTGTDAAAPGAYTFRIPRTHLTTTWTPGRLLRGRPKALSSAALRTVNPRAGC